MPWPVHMTNITTGRRRTKYDSVPRLQYRDKLRDAARGAHADPDAVTATMSRRLSVAVWTFDRHFTAIRSVVWAK